MVKIGAVIYSIERKMGAANVLIWEPAGRETNSMNLSFHTMRLKVGNFRRKVHILI